MSVFILKPEDIKNFRKKFNISQRELTAILGYGKMTINRYERGFIPKNSKTLFLSLIINNEKIFFEFVNDAYINFKISPKTYMKIIKAV